MDVITAYRQVGTYRGAAGMCGVIHKTVKRIIDHGPGRVDPGRAGRRSGRAEVAARVDAATCDALEEGRVAGRRMLLSEAVAYALA